MTAAISTITAPQCGGPHLNRTQFESERIPALANARRVFLLVSNMNLDFAKSDGLVTAVIQDAASKRVLMVGYMNEEAFRRTVETGFATFYSRSRRKLWLKGESSGHKLAVKEISADCDLDAVLVAVEALGPGVCHEGYQSCFYQRLEDGEWKVVDDHSYDPSEVYGGKA